MIQTLNDNPIGFAIEHLVINILLLFANGDYDNTENI